MWTSQRALISPWWKATVKGRSLQSLYIQNNKCFPNKHPVMLFVSASLQHHSLWRGILHNRRQKRDLRKTRVVKRGFQHSHSFVGTPHKAELYDQPVCC